MNVKRILEEMARGDMPPSRLDPQAAYEGGLRLCRVRRTRQRLTALFGVVAAMAVLGIAHAVTTARPPVIVPGSPSPIPSSASPTASATPTATPSAQRVDRPSALDCGKTATLVLQALRTQGFQQKVSTTCRDLRFTATTVLSTSPIRITMTIKVSMHLPPDAAALSCSGRPGVCEQANSASLARGDGMLIDVRISVDGQAYGASDGTQEQDLRSLVLDLNSTL